MEKGYKFRIYPSPEQAVLIAKTFGCVRFIYNFFLNMRQALYKAGQITMGYGACSRSLTLLKKELPWLNEPDSVALQSSVRHLQDAYDNFFAAKERGDKDWGLPVFKSKKDNEKSYTTKHTNGNIKMFDKHIKLPKLGMVECRVSKQVRGRILNATVSQSPSGKYYVSINCTDEVIRQFPKTGSVIGLDLGLKEFAIDSNGQTYENHKFLRKSERKLARLQRRHSRKQSGSRNRGKARVKVARMHEYIANSRNDAHHKLSTALVREHDIIAIEGLQVKNMVKNRRLSKAISDASWSEFKRQLKYKAEWYGKTVVETGTFFASTQKCSTPGCAYKNVDAKNLGVRQWSCPECGAAHERDHNAAINVRDEGMRLLAEKESA